MCKYKVGQKKLHKVRIIASKQPFQIKVNGFHQNVPRVSDNEE